MKLSSVELWQRISAAGLASPMQCRGWAAEALQGLQPEEATDSDKIIDQLVRIGRLTPYQADVLCGRIVGEIRRDGWFIFGTVESPGWQKWKLAAKSLAGDRIWVRWLTGSQLAELQPAAPSLPFGLRNSQIKGGPRLQSIHPPEMANQQLILQVSPIQGTSLANSGNRFRSFDKSLVVIRQIAEALQPMHAAGLAHGRVMPDRIYWDDLHGVTLARDPLCQMTAGTDSTCVGLIDDGLLGLNAAQFLAPEFLAPGQAATPTSDMYSIGCLWWWMISGQPFVQGATASDQLAAQVTANLKLIPPNTELPTPFLRCLQHCLAKNLTARFTSAAELLDALDAAQIAIDRGPVRKSAQIADQSATLPPVPVQADATKAQGATPSKLTKTPDRSVMDKQSASPLPSKPTTTASTATPIPNATASSPLASGPTKVQSQELTPTPPRAPSGTKGSATKIPNSTPTESGPSPSLVPVEVVAKVAGTPVRPTNTDSIATNAEFEPAVANRTTEPRTPPSGSGVAPEKIAVVEKEGTQREQPPMEANSSNASPSSGQTHVGAPTIASNPKAVGPIGTRPSTSKKSIKKRKSVGKSKKPHPILMAAVGGLGILILVLVAVLASGVNRSSGSNDQASKNRSEAVETKKATEGGEADKESVDARASVFQVVSGNADTLFVPPALPKPFALELLPPGGQCFIHVRPQQLLDGVFSKNLLASLNDDLSPLLDQVAKLAMVPLQSMSAMTIAVYGEEKITYALRVELAVPQSLSALKKSWKITGQEGNANRQCMVNADGIGFYVKEQPLSDAQSVKEFACGPKALLVQAAELEGAAGPLVTQLDKLWRNSDADAEVCILASAPFLFADGRALLADAPPRFTTHFKDLLSIDTRALLVQMRFEPQWYMESRWMGGSERDAGRILDRVKTRFSSLSTMVDEWFVSEQPHPYWRGLAVRYSRMLQALTDNMRFGIEGGAAIANAYLPSEAAPNLLLASWLALQPAATMGIDATSEVTATTNNARPKPMTDDEFLGRKINVRFDQEAIEVALKLVGDEANAGVDGNSYRFLLDGSAFEKAGITRNQQLRDFNHQNAPVRDALTAIARRGNPVTTVKDTREEDQRLIWVVRDDPEKPGGKLVLLTTRVAATSEGIPLPVEFAPPK